MADFEDRFKALLTVGAAEPRLATPGANGASTKGASPPRPRPEVAGIGTQVGSVYATDRNPSDARAGGGGENEYTMLLMVARRGA